MILFTGDITQNLNNFEFHCNEKIWREKESKKNA